ncbi:MAG: filamentous hemagglutinin N-terminal domain-containing protein [Hydrococcus sp. SU_1_0]|nr:filamentous hemagglutinin N-terminal domain-containing protein [Hydrococcus sp. SU_1_0]
MHKALSPLFQLSLCTLSCLYAGSTQAQVTSDGTVNTQVNQNGNTAEITGGETRGDNLFHSFQDFSVGTGDTASFLNANEIANIFSRVTGGNISNIDGLIRANGSANLFLINPAGIIFGENASLDIGGSFYGSSADSILFEDGEFSATDLDNPPLLTINAPIGLGFRDEPTSITNRSDTLNPTGEIPLGLGLEVEQGQNISLFGGEINFEAGFVYAPGGRVELGGLSEAGTINFDANLQAIFPENVARADVNLTGGSVAFVRSNGGGEINVNARNINLIDGSQLFEGIAENMGSPEAQAGNITLNATDDITFDGINTDRNFPSGISNVVQAGATGNGGDILISARNLSLTNGGQIFTSLFGQGNAGNININATNVLIDGQGNTDASTGVFGLVSSNGIGNGGNISITTDSFTLRNIASLDTSNSGQGNGGNININASDSISVEGQGGTSFNTNIFTSAFNSSGNAGNIDLTTGSLSLNNGALLVASGNDQSSAGEITIRANDAVSLANQSNINVTTGADGGFLNISAKSLEITSQSNLVAGINIDSGSAETQAGDIVINVAENVLIDSLGESSQATTSISNTNFSTGNAGILLSMLKILILTMVVIFLIPIADKEILEA